MKGSASKFGLLRKCQAWASDSAQWYDPPSDAAQSGTDNHKLVEVDLETGSFALPVSRWLLGVLPKELHADRMSGRNRIQAEVGVGLDLSSGDCAVLSNSGGHRDYPKGWFCGTADAIVRHFGTIYVFDWKYGKVRDYHTDQLEVLSAMFVKALGADMAIARAVYLNDDHTLRFEPTVHTFTNTHRVLDDCADLANGAEDAVPWVGPHCAQQYCPHAAYCSAGDKPMRDLMNEKLEVNEHNAAELVQLLPLLQKRLDKVNNDLRSLARRDGGIVVSEGKVWKERFSNYRTLDQKKAAEAALKAGLTEEELYKTGKRSAGFGY
jgi:hypothetical protein